MEPKRRPPDVEIEVVDIPIAVEIGRKRPQVERPQLLSDVLGRGNDQQLRAELSQELRDRLSYCSAARSSTRIVPSGVPSLFHNSTPWTPSLAAKYSVPLAFTKLRRDRSCRPPARMSLYKHGARIRAVAFPKLGSSRAISGLEVKRPPDVDEILTADPPLPATISLTRTVPPSFRRSSTTRSSSRSCGRGRTAFRQRLSDSEDSSFRR